MECGFGVSVYWGFNMGTSSSSTHDSSRAWVVNNTQKEVM
jgi:hypothetical protein